METEELHRRMMLLREELERGRLHIASHLRKGFESSLAAVRLDEHGIVIPSTVDSRLRATASILAFRQDREEWKDAAPSGDIQHAYFERVRSWFGELYDFMVEKNATPYQFARWFSAQPDHVEKNFVEFQRFVDEVKSFWDNAAEPAWIHAEDQAELKATFGGELFPNGEHNAASMYGFYIDTIILPDPFLKITPLLSHWSREKQVFEITRLALQVLQYEEVALADIEPPIVAILPDRFTIETEYRDDIGKAATSHALKHAIRLFGRPFESAEEVAEYVRQMKTPAQVEDAIKQPGLLMFSSDWLGTTAEQVKRFQDGDGAVWDEKTAGGIVWLHVLSRMGQVTDILRRSFQTRGVPVIHAETSWRWFNWRLEYGSNVDNYADLTELHVVRALQEASAEQFTWLGNVPPAALIEMRRQGAMDEIRRTVSDGVSELAHANPSNFVSTSRQVVGNLRLAFADHNRAVKKLRDRRWKFAGRAIGSFIVGGTIEVAAAANGIPLFGAGAALLGLSGVIPSARDLVIKSKELGEDAKELERSPVGLFFKRDY